MKKVAINGFGRIGRIVAQVILDKYSETLDLVAVNDLADNQTLALLFQFDSTYGQYHEEVTATDDCIQVGDKEIKAFAEREPEKLPWKELGVDIVLECTGFFRTREGMQKHITAGAKKVVVSAPAKDAIDGTFVIGVNEEIYDPENHHLISNASCTTNCLAPVAKALDEAFGIEKGLMTTIHAYTGGQKLLDAPHKDIRRGRAAALSMVPTTTGAAKAVGMVLPHLEGKLNGISIRVPLPTVSVVDLTVSVSKKTTKEEVNALFQKASEGKLKGILALETRPLVSVDFKKDCRSSIVDAAMTDVMGGDLVKVLSWYDNEWGYSCRLADLAAMA